MGSYQESLLRKRGPVPTCPEDQIVESEQDCYRGHLTKAKLSRNIDAVPPTLEDAQRNDQDP